MFFISKHTQSKSKYILIVQLRYLLSAFALIFSKKNTKKIFSKKQNIPQNLQFIAFYLA